MNYTLFPVINADELRRAVNQQYGVEIEDLADLLFPSEYQNDSYKYFYYDELEEYHGFPWEDEEEIRLTNLVKTYLKDTLPKYDAVLIDVSW